MTKQHEITVQPTQSHHIYMMDLANNGILSECAVMKKDALGNYYFIEVSSLDAIDHKRLAKIVNHQNADRLELWDLMSQVTLGNGVNALTYFQQLVKMVTPLGQIIDHKGGKRGYNMNAVKSDEVEEVKPAAAVKTTTKTAAKK